MKHGHARLHVQTLERDLRGIFGSRLQSLVIYGQRARAGHGDGHHEHDGPPTPTLAVVESMTHDDLRTAAGRVAAWHDAGLATPLLLAAREFERSLDAFPLEFGAILADHVVVSGSNPFASLAVDAADVRRACEVQARSHLLHLREGFLETRGRGDALVGPDRAVGARLRGAGREHRPARGPQRRRSRCRGAARRTHPRPARRESTEVTKLAGVKEITSADAERLFPPYLAAVERLVEHVDGWSAR